MLLSWFGDGELEVCPQCLESHLLPLWGSATASDRVCVSCGLVPTTALVNTVTADQLAG
jgi:Zn ribbon nucleic-acid-binding protein